MRTLFIWALILATGLPVLGQNVEEGNTGYSDQVERVVELDEQIPEDDSRLQMLEWYKRHPLMINSADEDDWRNLGLLTGDQIRAILNYHRIFGPFVSIYELQAVPGLEAELLRRMAPFVRVDEEAVLAGPLFSRFRGGESSVLTRYGRAFGNNSDQYYSDSTGKAYLGSADKLMIRYKYNFRNCLQYGFTVEKDAGEPLWGKVAGGFDFFSFHLFTRKLGQLNALALGDFQVNLGQGLLQWQGFNFGRASSVVSVTKEGNVLQPYNSTGEYNFYRGAGIGWSGGRWECNGFVSIRNLSANLVQDSLVPRPVAVSSIQTSGYHRTAAETADRNSLLVVSSGGSVRYRFPLGHIGIQSIHHYFNHPIQKNEEPYNLFAHSGRRMTGWSIDFDFSFSNLHPFGEWALDQSAHPAFVLGVLMSLDTHWDLALLYRNIHPAYQSLFSNAETVSARPVNEKGLYAGLAFHPAAGWKFEGYTDQFSRPWLAYRIDQPSRGTESAICIQYNPDRKAEIKLRWRMRNREMNSSDPSLPLAELEMVKQQNLRAQFRQKLPNEMVLTNRMEYVTYKVARKSREEGYLWFTELSFHLRPNSRGSVRAQYFETSGYDSRLYAYESDLLYSYSVPAFYGKGIRLYGNFSTRFKMGWVSGEKKNPAVLRLWLRLSANLFPFQNSVDPGQARRMNEYEMKIQAEWRL